MYIVHVHAYCVHIHNAQCTCTCTQCTCTLYMYIYLHTYCVHVILLFMYMHYAYIFTRTNFLLSIFPLSTCIHPFLPKYMYIYICIHLLLTAPEIKLAFGVEVALVPSQPWIQAPDHLILSSTGCQKRRERERGGGKKGGR